MAVPILELISSIIEKGKFVKSKQSDAKLKLHIQKLFSLYNSEKEQTNARMLYSAIIDLARLGKGSLAHEFAMKFEKEVGYDELGELN